MRNTLDLYRNFLTSPNTHLSATLTPMKHFFLLTIFTVVLSACAVTQQTSMHPSWDADQDGINDCEKEGICDDSVDYSEPRKEGDTSENSGSLEVYTEASWKTMIDASCLRFFDGCNNCRREEGSELAACTKKFCLAYEKPVCLDE